MSCDILLIDGNSMLFRAYYATLYSGARMSTSNGISTNAVYGFVNMINKAIKKIDPNYVMVAWDSGKPTFRHEQFSDYKGTRKELDPELKVQFPIVREFLDAYGIFRYEEEGIEADDIIGTLAKRYKDHKVYILSSDNDLLQLIDNTTEVLLMKKGISEMQTMNEEALLETKHVKPWQIIEMKGLMGDASDNIPGVKGVGEKTALKLLHEYESVEGVYEHIDDLKGKLKEKLIDGKDMAFLSKDLATIKIDCDVPVKLEDFEYEENVEALNTFYSKYEMNSLVRDIEVKPKKVLSQLKQVDKLPKELLEKDVFIFLDYDNGLFYDATLYGMVVKTDEDAYYISKDNMLIDKVSNALFTSKGKRIGYNVKMTYHLLDRYGFKFDSFDFDIMIASFLVNNNISNFEQLLDAYNLNFGIKKDDVYGKAGKPKFADEETRLHFMNAQSDALYQIYPSITKEIETKELNKVLYDIEMPISIILYEMEKEGVSTSKEVLEEIRLKTLDKLKALERKIFALSGSEFNVNSPKQLAEVLFDKLGLKSNKKRSTAIDVLEKLQHAHPVIPELIMYRKYQKINSTYAEGLQKHILKDGRIHTIYHQSLTQTGRLSSSDPNLQNLSVKDDDAREIRKAFVASEGCVLYAADYSQIELRVLAHMAQEKQMIDAFNTGVDIHTKTAMLIFNVNEDEVTPLMRREAKTVNFGMVYGQTQFGLASELNIDMNAAKDFMDGYFESYPKIKDFMDETISFCKEHGYVTTMFKRRRIINEIHDKNYMIREFGKRAAMNAPIQGTAADLIKMAMIKVVTSMKEKNMKSKLILQIHDELVFDVVLDEVDAMEKIVKNAMEHVYKLSVPLVIDGKFADNYYDSK
ncbi:DNA polymerase-1 [Breznakia sp. PF5-3]|uniref:DNA polymerase I n=1 Tax=unclassified Breznakia TaxID=2623764 RepID=UPI002404C0DA|nr:MULTISPECIES: DNA polymerase I [unclassified Breznakia]MDF9823738.1 DNA polymerase-1 [Breznakia sp. PM6-1]MDF9834536.1 DNA polymerase-1 [Breznakia sp. PF5-3]MDF9838708.1 DNA polymerase-1 [Breznakia sp. PFB2-8]MDF9860739.1 DNA polymerase-1 [Breznakia sp. PH5-24]